MRATKERVDRVIQVTQLEHFAVTRAAMGSQRIRGRDPVYVIGDFTDVFLGYVVDGGFDEVQLFPNGPA